jgi:mannose/fructose/N-acetylgalactosamine-specific phosphotransferase system component IIC
MTALADRSWLHMSAAFLSMGGWAVWANAAHPMPAPLLAGLVQGLLSATITLGLKRMVEAVARRWPGPGLVPRAMALAGGVSVTLLGSVHGLAGTPEVLRTLAVPASVATLYAGLYAWRLRGRRHG